MKIPVTTNTERFYLQLVKLLASFVTPFNKLDPVSKKVLAEILYQNYTLRSIKQKNREIIIFSSKNRKTTREKLNLTESAYNVYLSELRKTGIITKDNELPLFLAKIIPQDEFEFTVLFKLKNDE